MIREKLQEVEDLIAQGQSGKARVLLHSIPLSKIPRALVTRFSYHCRRAGLPELGLKSLRPIVRSTNSTMSPSLEEKSEYAHSLGTIGGSEEAVQLLADCQEFPQAKLYMAFSLFAQWNYQEAIPFLQSYLQDMDNDSYKYQIGLVNYAAALVAVDQFATAEPILQKLIRNFDRQQHQILAGNCRELSAQISFHKKDYSKALHLLQQAQQNLGKKIPDTLYVNKWEALILQAMQPDSPETHSKLALVKKVATENHHWETLRDLDLNLSLINNDQKLFDQVYFGTPLPGWRKRTLKRSSLKPSAFFFRHLGGVKSQKVIPMTDVKNGRAFGLKNSSLQHRLLQTLCEDFYRPRRITNLFSCLYPEEYFDVESSTQKTKMLISRLRKTLKPMGLEISELAGTGYFLEAPQPICLKYTELEDSFGDKLEIRFDLFTNQYKDNFFSCQNVADHLQVSPSTALRWINNFEEKGWIEKVGSGRSSRYRIQCKFLKKIA